MTDDCATFHCRCRRIRGQMQVLTTDESTSISNLGIDIDMLDYSIGQIKPHAIYIPSIDDIYVDTFKGYFMLKCRHCRTKFPLVMFQNKLLMLAAFSYISNDIISYSDSTPLHGHINFCRDLMPYFCVAQIPPSPVMIPRDDPQIDISPADFDLDDYGDTEASSPEVCVGSFTRSSLMNDFF